MRSNSPTPASVARKLAEGRGTGHGSAYRPWLTVQEVRSKGYVSRIPGWKTKRQHEFLSRLESDFFFMLEWAESVTDIREQFPLLPLEETLTIARDCGIEHPKDPKIRSPIVMTSDFRLTLQHGFTSIDLVRTVKPASALASERTIQKFEIERRYWKARNIDWAIVTEKEIPDALVRNVQWVHSFFDISATGHVTTATRTAISKMVAGFLAEGHALSASALACDDRLGLDDGTSLSVVRHLIATREWQIEMHRRIEPNQPLKILNCRELANRNCNELVQESAA